MMHTHPLHVGLVMISRTCTITHMVAYSQARTVPGAAARANPQQWVGRCGAHSTLCITGFAMRNATCMAIHKVIIEHGDMESGQCLGLLQEPAWL